MATDPQPTYGNGKICYIQIPAFDIAQSSLFYQSVFGWNIRIRGNGTIAFDDCVGQVSGTWVLDRKPMTDVGLLVYIMVNDIEESIRLIIQHGGKIIQPVGLDAPEITARFSDPGGNILGVYQERG